MVPMTPSAAAPQPDFPTLAPSFPCAITTHPIIAQHSPDNDAHQPHNSLIEAVEEVPQDSALVFHSANDQPKGHREDHKAQGIDAIG